jgi:hypothetical protein
MALQTKDANISASMALVRATIEGIKSFDVASLESDVAATLAKLKQAGVNMVTVNDTGKGCAHAFIREVVNNLETCFSDAVSSLCSLHQILKQKPSSPDFTKIANILGISSLEMQKEWEFIQRLDGDLSSNEQMINMATSSQYTRMYPTFCSAIRRLLLLPIGTATVERSFSTLNRILSNKRCRLTPDHVRHLMMISAEGPPIPDVRNATLKQENVMNKFLSDAYKYWIRKPHRF